MTQSQLIEAQTALINRTQQLQRETAANLQLRSRLYILSEIGETQLRLIALYDQLRSDIAAQYTADVEWYESQLQAQQFDINELKSKNNDLLDAILDRNIAVGQLEDQVTDLQSLNNELAEPYRNVVDNANYEDGISYGGTE